MNQESRELAELNVTAGGNASPLQSISRYATALRRGYIVAIAILVLVSLTSFLTLHNQLEVQNEAVVARNLILKQRHDLSRAQAIVGLILQSLDDRLTPPTQMNDARAELKPLPDQLRARQATIDKLLRPLIGNGDDEVRLAAELLSSRVGEVADRLTTLMADVGSHTHWRFSLWAPLILDVAYGGPLMSLIDKELIYLDARVRTLAERSQSINGALALIALIVLATEVMFIFRPLLRRLLCLGGELNTATRELEYAALHDALTGIGNRKLLQSTVEDARDNPSRPRVGALMIIDIDDFKSINDVYGHPTGDEVLCRTAERIERSLGDRGQVFRSGGDEFVVVWFGDCDAAVATRVAERVTSAVTLPLTIAEASASPIYCTAAIGVALADGGQPSSLIDLMRAGDLALREAKLPNQTSVIVYGHGSTLRLREMLEVGTQFAKALEQGQVQPYYQPIVNLDSGEIVGFEALARWITPDLGVRLPDTFLPMVEYDRRSGALAETIFRQVARDRSTFISAGATNCTIAVNLTESNLIDEYLLERVVEWVGSRDLTWLSVEVVETALLHRSWQRINDNLMRFVHLGASVSLDDFGTGYASLQHLLSVPCKSIKIDNSFVARLNEDPGVRRVINGMVEMAQSLGIGVVIEGIETDEQRSYFQSRWRGLRAQGFAYGVPVPAQDIVRLLECRHWTTAST